jgi:hypothetical protein
VPRRHAVQLSHLGDHVSPTGNLFIRCQSEGSDFLRPMADYAALIENRRNVFRIGDCRVGDGFAIATDQASRYVSFWERDGGAHQ